MAVGSCVAFVILATANAAGYRYGVSDQAFYIPSFVRALDPSAFPRDRTLLDAQARLMVVDEAVAAVVRAAGLSIPAVCAFGYFASLLLIWAALIRIGRTLYLTRWGVVALLAAFTLRHQITRTSANSFEPYFHPRMLAFGLGALAVAEVLRARRWTPIALVAIAAAIHITTAAWFAVLLGVALIVADRSLRPVLIGGAAVAVVAAIWATTLGPLAGGIIRIDPEWRAVLETKDTLFAHEWPIAAWGANLGTAGVWAWAWWQRRRAGVATRTDTGLGAGGATLVALFLVTLPLSAAGIWLIVELQISRVFWLIDFLATVYVIAACESRWSSPRVMTWVAAGLLLLSVVRGVYILAVERPERSLFMFNLPTSTWTDAMRWLKQTPVGAHVLADPGHAYLYGSSVRVAAERDVFHEEVKDSALAIYSRAVAVRVAERGRALGDFTQLTAARARDLARQYDLDYLVTTATIDLPVAYQNGEFRIYALR